MLDTLVKTPLAVINTIASIMRQANAATKTGGSLNEYTKALRVEPIVLIDQSVESLPYTEDVLKTCLTMFSAYYLQAVALSVNIGKVDVAKMFDHLNPERRGGWISNESLRFGVESFSLVDPASYAGGLPRLRFETPSMERVTDDDIEEAKIIYDAGHALNSRVNIKLDTEKGGLQITSKSADLTEGSVEPVLTGQRVDKKGYDFVEKPDLVVGNILDVHIESDGHKAVIPITVRLLPSVIRSEVLVHILSKNERNLSLQERWHELRAGQIQFWRDLVLCQDLIDEHKATLVKDKSGQYQEILKRRLKNRGAAFKSGKQSVADASNIVIMSNASSVKFEAACGGRLKDFRTRERVFEETYLMLMVVIDPEWEQATIYHRGISLPTNISVKAMRQNNKKGGVDVSEVLKAYQLGNSPL